VIGAWKAALTNKTRLVGSVDGGWPKAAHIAVTLKKGSGLVEPVQIALNGVIKNGDYEKVLNWGEGVEKIPTSESTPPDWATKEAQMSERFRDISPDAPELQPVIAGLFGEYAARYGDYFSKDAEVELTVVSPPQGLFIVLERDGAIIATGAYKPKDAHTAEIKRIWTQHTLRKQGLARRVVAELERRAVLATAASF
jgi:predicted GNAT family acetyltransferase